MPFIVFEVNRMTVFQPVEASSFGAHPHVPGVVDGDGQDVRMRKPIYRADVVADHAIQSC